MARRLLTVLVVLALTTVAVPARAEVDPVRLDRVSFQGGSALAIWENAEAGTFAEAKVIEDADFMILVVTREIRDAQGDVIGSSLLATEAPWTPYGTFSIDRQLLSASLSVTGVPGVLCESDLGGNFTCTDTQIDANVTWSGYGQITRSTFTAHDAFREAGFHLVSIIRSTGSDRSADAEGTINGLVLPSEDLTRGVLEFSNFGSVSVQICLDC